MAMEGGDPTLALSNFDYAGTLTEFVLLGNAAMLAGKKLTYDAKEMKFNEAESEKFLKREYRTGWKL